MFRQKIYQIKILIRKVKKISNGFNSLLFGCRLLQKNKCKFIVIPCNTAHYWYNDLKKKINIPIINMPEEVYKFTKKNVKKFKNWFIGN